jgi:hypothetical protein
MLILLAFFYSIANLMTEFLLVAENVTETEDADFVLYFGENLSFVPDYADWTWSDTLRSPFKDKGIMLGVPSYYHTSTTRKEDEGKTM